jgi:hypothetical protein
LPLRAYAALKTDVALGRITTGSLGAHARARMEVNVECSGARESRQRATGP